MELEFKTLYRVAQKLTLMRSSGKSWISPTDLKRLVDEIQPTEEGPYTIEKYLIEEGLLFRLTDGKNGPTVAILIHKDAIKNVESKHEREYAELKKSAEPAKDSTAIRVQYATIKRKGSGILFEFLQKLESKYPCGTKIPCRALRNLWDHPSITWAAARVKVLEVLEIVDPSAPRIRYEYQLPYNWDQLIESKKLSISDKIRFSHLKEGEKPSDDVVQVILKTLGTPITDVLKHLESIGYTSSLRELPKVVNSWSDFEFQASKDAIGVRSTTINGYPAIVWYRHKYLGIDLPDRRSPDTTVQAIATQGNPKLSLGWKVEFTFNNGIRVYQLSFNKFDPSFDWIKLKDDLDQLDVQCVGRKSGMEGLKSIQSLKSLIALKVDQSALLDDI